MTTRQPARPDNRPPVSMRPPSGPQPHPALRPLAVGTLIATYCLALLGSTVRVTESGMGCRSWPLCNGQIGPIDRFHALLEQSHRYLAAGVSIGVVVLLVLAWRSGARRARWWAGASVGIVVVQVGLGALTVLTHNAPWTVALHLIVGLLLLAAVTLTAVATFDRHGDEGLGRARRRPGRLGWSALVATFVLLISGSLVVDGGASGACPSWPLCSPHGGIGWNLVILQLVHRTMAAVAVVLISSLAVRTLRRRPVARPSRWLAAALLGFLAVQVGVGATSALLQAPPAVQDVHLGLAAAIWTLTVTLVAFGAPERARSRADAPTRTDPIVAAGLPAH